MGDIRNRKLIIALSLEDIFSAFAYEKINGQRRTGINSLNNLHNKTFNFCGRFDLWQPPSGFITRLIAREICIGGLLKTVDG